MRRYRIAQEGGDGATAAPLSEVAVKEVACSAIDVEGTACYVVEGMGADAYQSADGSAGESIADYEEVRKAVCEAMPGKDAGELRSCAPPPDQPEILEALSDEGDMR